MLDVAGVAESTTFTVNDHVPRLVGVPEMTPVDGLTIRPGGNLPEAIDHANGACPPDKASAAE